VEYKIVTKSLLAKIKDQNKLDSFFDKESLIHREFGHERRRVNSQSYVKALEVFIETDFEIEAVNLR
jgi:hypothetical protein